MLKVLDTTRKEIGVITDYQDLKIERDLKTGDSEISFTYLGHDRIPAEYYVQTEDARYTIKEVKPDEDGTEYHGKLDLEDLQRTPYKQFTSTKQTVTATATRALAGTGWTVSTAFITKKNVQKFKCLPLDILYAIRDRWMAEIRFDNLNNVVYFSKHFGWDRGVYFIRGLNLRQATTSIDSYDYVTRIIPYGADGLTIESVNDGIPYVENYQYSTKILTMIWEDTEYDDPTELMEDAAQKLDELSKPKSSYDCDVIDLAKMSGDYSVMDYALGDTIHLIDGLTGVDDTQRIVKITEYPEFPEKNSCELSNTALTLEEIQSRADAAADAWEDIKNPDGSVNGVYVHGVQAGSVVGIETVITENAAVQGSVTNVRILYAEGNSGSSAPTTGWTTEQPAWDTGKYIWTKTEKTYTSGDVVETDPALSSTHELAKAAYAEAETVGSGLTDLEASVEHLKESTVLFTTTTSDSGTMTTVTAHIYADGEEVTDDYPAEWFEWTRVTEAGQVSLGTGKSVTVSNDDFLYGGVVRTIFMTAEDQNLVLSGGNLVISGGNLVIA